MSIDTKIINAINSIEARTFTHVDVANAAKVTESKAYGECKRLAASGKLTRMKQGLKVVYTKDTNASSEVEAVPMISTRHHEICINDRFKYIEKFTSMVAKGVSPSLLLTGQAGVGKTFTVTDVLKKSGLVQNEDFVIVKGHSSPMGLYKTLYYNMDKIIIFDDCDNIWSDKTSINLLKAALDSYETRTINWNSMATERMDIPSEFEFTGSIIFISNMDAERLDAAVVSRTITANLRMTNLEILDRIEAIMEKLEAKIDMSIKKEVIDYIREINGYFNNLSIRTFIQATRIRVGNVDGWKDMVKWCV